MNIEFEQVKADAVIISIKNVIVQCLKHMKHILISSIICALLVSIVVYIRDLNLYNNTLSNGVQETELTEDDRVAIEKYIQLKNKFELMNEYKDNSLYIQLEFTNVHQGILVYQVMSEDGLKNDLANAIVCYVNEGNMVSELKHEYPEIETKYLQELISAEIVDESENGISGVINISVWTESEEMSSDLISKIAKQIDDYANILKKEVGYCSVKKVQEGTAVRYLKSIYETQKQFYKDLEEVRTEYNTQKSQMTEYQLSSIASMDNEDNETLNATDIAKPTVNIKFAVVGVILGAMIVIMYVCIRTILGGKIQTEKEIGLRLGISHLGSICFAGKNIIEKFILRFLYRMNYQEKDRQIELIVSRICMRLQSDGINKIALIGTAKQETFMEMKNIAQELEKEGIQSMLLGNILVDANMMDSLAEVENIIFVESVGETKIRELYEEATICINAKKTVVGYIAILE